MLDRLSSPTRRVSVLALAFALWALPPVLPAQLGGLSWTLSSCATTSGNQMSLDVCGACVFNKLAAAFADVPIAGTVDVDVEWSTSAACCQKLDVVRLDHFTGASVDVAGIGSFAGPSWCSPAATPCTGSTHFSFAVQALDTLAIRLASQTVVCSGSTTVVLKNWVFTPNPAPSLHSATPKESWNPGQVTLEGTNFDPAMQVRVDGSDCVVVTATPTQALVQVPPGVPGWSEVEMSNSLGTASFAHAMEQWPSLTSTLSPLSPPLLSLRIESNAAGNYLLAWSPKSLVQPIPVLTGTWYGLLLDPAGLTLLVAGAIPASGVATLQFGVQVGGGTHLIPTQALVISGSPAVASFTNLHLVQF